VDARLLDDRDRVHAAMTPLIVHELNAPRTAPSLDPGTRTLERRFKTGLSLGQWCKQARFLHALRSLGDGVTVKRAAQNTGYRSPSAFIAAFRAALGVTPSRYFPSAAAAAAAGPAATPESGRASRRPPNLP
jgi:AraC-like DNA-binding protein